MVCDTCTKLNAKLLCGATEAEARTLYQVAKDKHIQQVKEDRYFYGMRITEAGQYSEDLWTMVIDWSDPSEWGIPHPAVKTRKPKGEETAMQVLWCYCAWAFCCVLRFEFSFTWGHQHHCRVLASNFPSPTRARQTLFLMTQHSIG